jgi:hypothetical protein
MRGGGPSFTTQSFRASFRTASGNGLMSLAFAISAGGASTCFLRGLSLCRWTQRHAGATSFGKTDGNRLLRGARAMFTLANVVHLFTHKFPGLSRCRFALPPVTPGPFKSLFFWHNYRCRLETISFALSASRETSLNRV